MIAVPSGVRVWLAVGRTDMRRDPVCPREVHLPGLREDQPSASTVPCDRPRLGGPSLLAMILF